MCPIVGDPFLDAYRFRRFGLLFPLRLATFFRSDLFQGVSADQMSEAPEFDCALDDWPESIFSLILTLILFCGAGNALNATNHNDNYVKDNFDRSRQFYKRLLLY